jgi:hypothetical protein
MRASRRLLVPSLLVLSGLLFSMGYGASVRSAHAHLKLSDGTWTWRYYTRDQGSNQDAECENNTGKTDPTNIININYGEWSRMNGHYETETHWGYWNISTSQVICITSDGSNWNQQAWKDDQDAHSTITGEQAHFRIFPAGHNHDDIAAKWSVLDVHHESLSTSGHKPNEDWEKWENHIVGINEIGEHHNIYTDYYYRVPAGDFRGQYDNGLITRVGGLHDGNY